MKAFLYSLCFLLSTTVSAQTELEKLPSHYTANEGAIYQELVSFLAIPNVATDTANIRRNADFLLQAMKARGIANLQLLEAEERGVPPVDDLVKVLNAKFLIVPIANADNNQHAENENLRVKNFREGIDTLASILLLK